MCCFIQRALCITRPDGFGVNFLGRQTLFRQTLSDRCYSDNPQSGRPSTSLAHLVISRNWEEIGRGPLQALHACKARHWSRHRGDWEKRGLGRVSWWVWGCPLLRQSYNVGLHPRHYCTAPNFLGFGSASFQSLLPVGLFNCSQPSDIPTVDCRNSVCQNRVCRTSVVYPISC